MSHTCRALIISCMDFRLHHALHNWADQRYGETGYDLVHLAGGAGALLRDDSQALVLKQVELSHRLHEIAEVVLVNHWDCGAYGGSQAFGHDEENERDTYCYDLEEASNLVRQRFPQISTVEALEHLNGSVEVVRETGSKSAAAS